MNSVLGKDLDRVYIVSRCTGADMTEFVQEEYKKIIIRKVVKVDLDDFIAIVSNADANLAYWTDGVLFTYFFTPESEAMSALEIEGKGYMEKVVFAKYPQFTRTVKSASNFEIAVVNMQTGGFYLDLVRWIKSRPIWDA